MTDVSFFNHGVIRFKNIPNRFFEDVYCKDCNNLYKQQSGHTRQRAEESDHISKKWDWDQKFLTKSHILQLLGLLSLLSPPFEMSHFRFSCIQSRPPSSETSHYSKPICLCVPNLNLAFTSNSSLLLLLLRE